MADEYEDLYGDLYPGEAEFGFAQPSTAPTTSTTDTATTSSASASAATPISAPASAAPPPLPSAIPSFADQPSAGNAGGQGQGGSNPPPLHFSPGYANQRQQEGRTGGVRPADMPEEGKMFIGGLNWDTTDDALKTYFEQFGTITHCTIMRDAESGRSRGFAFLTFSDPASVNAVMQREHHLDGKTIDPKRAIPRTETSKSDKLFVRALPPSCTQESFRAFWRQFGPISDATLMMDKETGRHRGFGFVNYEDRTVVDKVLMSGPHYMDGQMLEVKRAQNKGEPRRPDYGVNTNQGGVGGGGHQNFNNHHHNQQQPNFGGQGGGFNNNMNGGMGGMGGGGFNNPMTGGVGMGGMNMGMNPMMGNMGMGGMGAMGGNAAGGGGAGGGGTPFDPAAMAKFFAQMGWGAWNPMMMGGMGGMSGGMGGGNPMMGMGGMGNFGGMGGMMGGGGGGGSEGSPAPGQGGDGGKEASPGASTAGQSQWTAPMSQQGAQPRNAPASRPGRGGAMGGQQGGRGGGRAGFNPPTGPASMRDDGGTGPQRNRGSGAGFHPYSR